MAFSGDQRPQLCEELRPLAAQNRLAAFHAVWNGTATPFALEWAHRSSGTGAPFDWNLQFRHMRTYKCAIIQDFEKIKRKAEVLDDGDEIKIIFKPGDDNTAVDTLKIPDTMSTT